MSLRSLLLACLAAFLLPPPAMAQTQEVASPSNTSSYVATTNPANQIVLGLPLVLNGAHDPSLYNLTADAYSLVSHDPASQMQIGNQLALVTPSSPYNNLTMPNETIAFISCDPSAYTGNIDLNTVLKSVTAQNVSAIIFYSSNTNFCNLTSPSPFQYQNYYTMTLQSDTSYVLQQISGTNGNHPGGFITSGQGFMNILAANNANGGPSPSTAVAMIILYSITGVITLLFLIIIVTGAIRAHRHPERYGPRNIIGRTRQSRAKGIARAMLDTIPIVKFGEQDPVAKPGDIELASEGVVMSGATATTTAENTDKNTTHTSTERAVQTESSTTGTPTATTTETAPAETAREAGEEHDEEGLGCSICTEDFERGQDIRVLPCNHKFHPACVDPWLLDVSGTCPLCRVDLRPAEDREPENENGTAAATTPANAENAPLPPPLDASAPTRRHTMRNFFDLRRLQGSTREERLSALRRFRQEQRSNNDNSNRIDEEGANRVDESRLHRVRRTIFRN